MYIPIEFYEVENCTLLVGLEPTTTQLYAECFKPQNYGYIYLYSTDDTLWHTVKPLV